MGLSDILIMEREPISCPCYNCDQLAVLLRSNLPTGEIAIQTGNRISSEKTTSPSRGLIILRSSFSERLLEVAQNLKAEWNAAYILGIFCADSDAPAALLRALRNHLDDFLCCPFQEREFLMRVQWLLLGNGVTAQDARQRAMNGRSHFEGLVGKSEQFLSSIEKIPSVARSDATVLIRGETGTGKEVVARTIHYQSPRHAKPFVPVNCGALPDHLVENELFGHARGAYTGATSSEKGLLAEAEGGSLFLDEVDSLSPSGQVKLLRFLQDREYRPLGSPKSRTADVRIIAASKADILERVQAHKFREDLYYRLNVVSLLLPRLRERIDDIPLLAEHFLNLHTRRNGRGPLRFAPGCLPKLMGYNWPGNIRELEGLIHRGVILTSSSILQPGDIALPSPNQGQKPESGYFHQAKAQAIEQFERSYLVDLMTTHKGNVSRAAKSAGKERRSFQRLLGKYGLDRAAFKSASN